MKGSEARCSHVSLLVINKNTARELQNKPLQRGCDAASASVVKLLSKGSLSKVYLVYISYL
jgi:hypothetical protein